jgi:cytidylate kinase
LVDPAVDSGSAPAVASGALFSNPDRSNPRSAARIVHLVSTSSSQPSTANAVPDPTAVVAIDGPSGAGKSTVARQLAQKLGFAFLDTGAMYRAVTWHFLQQGCAPAECAGHQDHGLHLMQQAMASAKFELRDGRVLVNGRDVTAHLRTREVESQVSAVSALPFVRAAMRDLQRSVALHGPIVAEGRDMGSVVFPRARWKVYLDAAPSERARRRCQDFHRQGRAVSEGDVLDEILVRDRLDSTRQDAPLRQAADALYVDSTGLTTDAVVVRLLGFVRGEPAERGIAPPSVPIDAPNRDVSLGRWKEAP